MIAGSVLLVLLAVICWFLTTIRVSSPSVDIFALGFVFAGLAVLLYNSNAFRGL